MTVDLPAVRAYLGNDGGAYADDEVEGALAAERALQAAACTLPADDDLTPAADARRAVLGEALCRRVHVNLARRGIPLGMQVSDVGAARLSTIDPEVRRLEGPYRKVRIG